MKDSTARNELTRIAKEACETRKELRSLQIAYDELFDFLATELHFDSAKSASFYNAMQHPLGEWPMSPRRLLRVTKTEIVRKKEKAK